SRGAIPANGSTQGSFSTTRRVKNSPGPGASGSVDLEPDREVDGQDDLERQPSSPERRVDGGQELQRRRSAEPSQAEQRMAPVLPASPQKDPGGDDGQEIEQLRARACGRGTSSGRHPDPARGRPAP